MNAIVPTAVRTERHDRNIRETMQKTGQSEAEVLKPRVAKIPLGRMGTPDEIAAALWCSLPPSVRASSPAPPSRLTEACRPRWLFVSLHLQGRRFEAISYSLIDAGDFCASLPR